MLEVDQAQHCPQPEPQPFAGQPDNTERTQGERRPERGEAAMEGRSYKRAEILKE